LILASLETAGWISFEHVLMMFGGGFSVGFIVTRLKRVEREVRDLKNLLGRRGPDG
jgi:hypothetical protein